MFNKPKWNFPGGNYSQPQGLDTADMETFAKDPIASLAREICQNSIDARHEGKKAIIEFHTFELVKSKIPGISTIEEEIKSCLEYWNDHKKIKTALENMLINLNKEKIVCLRISDFNTTGLEGVTDTDRSPFYLLTKGSGISTKEGSTGGSKGIGKFASFVASSLNTVFYSTYNKSGEEGHIGICKLCSTKTRDNSGDKTIGIGYYGADKKNNPFLRQIFLDDSFKRDSYGTDIYIIGFRNNDFWERDIITQTLDSFICAIHFGDLEVRINDIVINSETLSSIVKSKEFSTKSLKKKIVSQHILLTDSQVHKETINITGYGDITVYLKEFSREEAELATHECVFIRYPYMKIKALKGISSIPCSAMCIIGDNDLNKILRERENPQHNDWYINDIDDPSQKAEIKNIIKELNEKIKDYVYKMLSSSDNSETDIEGASDYLPESQNDDGLGASQEPSTSEMPVISKKIRSKIKETSGATENEEGNTLTPDIGDYDAGEGSPVPEGHNQGGGRDIRDADREKEPKSGDNEIATLTQLSGVQYRFFVVDKNIGKSVISFANPYNEDNCELELYYLDDSDARYKVDILSCKINGDDAEIKEGKVVNFKLINNSNYKFEIITDLHELYACEVKMYARR